MDEVLKVWVLCHCRPFLSERRQELPYEMKIKLKGSQSIYFTPLGKTTKVNLKANWNTPSFDGNYLPEKREITEKDFSAQWQVLNLNRNYPQVLVNYQNASVKDIQNSNFGVNLKMPGRTVPAVYALY